MKFNRFNCNHKYCNGKRAYSKKCAISAANKRFKEDHIKLRIYPCPKCGMWHLTKQVTDIWREGRNYKNYR